MLGGAKFFDKPAKSNKREMEERTSLSEENLGICLCNVRKKIGYTYFK